MPHEQGKDGKVAALDEPCLAILSEQLRLLTKSYIDLEINLVSAALVSAILCRLGLCWGAGLLLRQTSRSGQYRACFS